MTTADIVYRGRAKRRDDEAKHRALAEAHEDMAVDEGLQALARRRLSPEPIDFMDDDLDMDRDRDEELSVRADLRCELDRGRVPQVREVF